MKKLNIDFLIDISKEELIVNINSIFELLLREIKLYLNLDMVFFEVKFEFIEDPNNLKTDFINFGLRKTLEKKKLKIFIYNSYKDFLKIILLRVAYKCFVPLELQDNEIINAFINEKVEIDFQNSDFIGDWKELRRKFIISYEFMEAELDRLGKFLKQESTEKSPSPFQYFFLYIRRNVDLMGYIKANFYPDKNIYDKFFEEYARKYTSYTEDILETIRIIIKIFYNVRKYGSILDYQSYFIKFKETGLIQTNLSKRKFAKCMQWIKNFSSIAPNYQINWPSLKIINTICYMRFHPKLKIKKIYAIIKQFPFFIWPNYSRNGFGLEVWGYILLPEAYLNDLINILDKLYLEGYLHRKKLFIITKPMYSINLNCFRLQNKVLINPMKRDYKTQYEIEFDFDYGQGFFESKLSILDWLLIDRIQHVSITGLGFERKSETLNAIKNDIMNEILSQRNLITKIKAILNKVYSLSILSKKILTLIDSNISYGFFYIKQILNEYVSLFDLIRNTLTKNPSINSLFQFQEFIRTQGISKRIEDNILFNKLKISTLKEIFSLFLKSKRKYDEKVREYYRFNDLFKSFHDLKLFNLESIKSIIKDESLIQQIYQSKEKKLRTSYENYKAYKITYQLLEKRIEDFLNNNPPVIKPQLLGTIVPIPGNYYVTLIIKNTPKTKEIINKIKWIFSWVLIVEMSDIKNQEKFINLQLQIPNLRLNEKKLLFSIIYNLFEKEIISTKSYLWGGFSESFSRKDFYDLEQEKYFYTKDLFYHFFKYIENTFGSKFDSITEFECDSIKDFWGKYTNISHLITQVEDRVLKEHIDLSLNNLNSLFDYNMNLKENLINSEEFKEFRGTYIFKNYIKSIKIIPAFQIFGFGQYVLYIYPTDLNNIDFKHFLQNTFQ
ncbi:MAG: hypothetical protein ACFFG0_39850, partial [Candidatus Thorarchaeota archaeon]